MNISMINNIEYEMRYAEIQGDLIELTDDLAARFPCDTEMQLLDKVSIFLNEYEA